MQKKLQFIFLPALLLFVLLSMSSTLFRLTEKLLFAGMLHPLQIPSLKMWALLPQIILILILFVVSTYVSYEKIFKGTLIALIALTSVLTALLFFLEKFSWPAALFYVGVNLLNLNLFSLLIWGFVNRHMSPSYGMKYYIPLAFVVGVITGLIGNFGIRMGASALPLMPLVITAIVLMLIAFLYFDWSWKRVPESLSHPKESGRALKFRFPYLGAAYLLAGALMVKSFLDVVFRRDLRAQFPDPSAYSQFLGRYALNIGLLVLVVSLIWVLLGSYLLLKKGWRTTAFIGSLSLLVGGAIYLIFPAMMQNRGLFAPLLIGTTSALFFPLVQILYLNVPYQIRFRTKVATEMIALPLMKALPMLTVQGLIMLLGSFTAVIIYIKIVIPTILLLLLVFVALRTGSNYFLNK